MGPALWLYSATDVLRKCSSGRGRGEDSGELKAVLLLQKGWARKNYKKVIHHKISRKIMLILFRHGNSHYMFYLWCYNPGPVNSAIPYPPVKITW